MTETEKVLDMNKRLGFVGTWTKRIHTIRGSQDIEAVRNTRTVDRQASILIGLNTPIPSGNSVST
jgi:hypothetical protein